MIATGSTAVLPPIPGLSDVPVLTNETLFSLNTLPDHLIVVGGGPIGVEMAQAFRRLGSRVTLLEAARLLGKDEPELVATLRERLASEGIDVREGVAIAKVAQSDAGIEVALAAEAEPVRGSHLLVAAGRKPRIEGLDLEKAGVAFSAKGITVDAQLRTSNARIYAVGDVAGGPLFTHVAGYHGGIVIRNALFKLSTKANYEALPWVTYADPELAHAGLTEADARARFGNAVRVATAEFSRNDRAEAERDTLGTIKVVLRRDGTVVGASILGEGAGELIHLWVLAISQHLKLRTLTGLIFPYPTRGEISKAAASAFYAPQLFSPWPRRLVRALSWFG